MIHNSHVYSRKKGKKGSILQNKSPTDQKLMYPVLVDSLFELSMSTNPHDMAIVTLRIHILAISSTSMGSRMHGT